MIIAQVKLIKNVWHCTATVANKVYTFSDPVIWRAKQQMIEHINILKELQRYNYKIEFTNV